MGELIEALHRLQDLALDLAAIRRKEAERERKVRAAQKQVRRAEEELETQHRLLQERQKRLDLIQLDIATRQETIKKHRAALTKARTNKEYAAVLAGINTAEADNSKIEMQALELMDEIQQIQEAMGSIREGQAKAQEKVDAASQVLEAYQAEVRDDVGKLEAEHDACAEGLGPSVLALFNRVADHHDGEAMATIILSHPKREEYACGGCNMQVNLEIVNALQTREDIQCCNVCGRILYYDVKKLRRSGLKR
jgi:predicted  nucleic acid-binding Zn-ribbon protein